MSKVVIQGNASGTGNFTIAAPNSNTDRTLTLPDEAGTVITTAGLPSGLVTASDLPSGSVLQVVHVDGPASTVSKTGAGSLTVLSAAITPSSTSNKVLVLGTAYASGNGGSNTWLQIEILKGATILKYGPYQGISLSGQGAALATNYLDSPSTTSETTYHVNIERGSSGTNGWDAAASRSSITLMEIAG